MPLNLLLVLESSTLPMINCNILCQLLLQIGPGLHEWGLRSFAWLIVAVVSVVVSVVVISVKFSNVARHNEGTIHIPNGQLQYPMALSILHIEHWLHEWDLCRAVHSLYNDSDCTSTTKNTLCILLSIFRSFFRSLVLLQIGVLAIGNNPMCSLLVTCYFTCQMISSTHSGLLPSAATTTCH
jgi:hypothetical protein